LASELKNKFVYQIITSATQVLVPLVTYPYITRILGPDSLGRVNYVDFLAQVFTILAAFGIPFYAIREIAAARNDAPKRALLIKEMTLLQTIFSITATIGFVLFTFNSWPANPTLYLLATINIIVSSFSFDWYIQGMEEFKFAAARTILIRLAMIIALFLFVKTNNDYTLYFGIFTAAVLIISILNSYKLLTENHFAKQPLNLRQHVKPLWHFFLTSSAISIYVYFDTIILQHITHNEQAVGYYTTVLKMVKVFLVAIIAIGTVLIPRLSYLASTGDTNEIKKYLNKLLQFIIVAGLPVGAGLFILAPEIIETIAGEKFLPAVPLMRILAFLPLIIGLSNLFCFQTLVPFKQEKKFLLAAGTGCIVSVSLNFLLIPHFAEAGAAYACMATELVITVITGMQANKLIRFNARPVLILQTVFTTLLFIPAVLLCKSLVVSPLFILLTAIPACMLIYFVVQYCIFNNIVTREIKDYVTSLIKF
jgi:O-antigen/teichoic acid export membrane protein